LIAEIGWPLSSEALMILSSISVMLRANTTEFSPYVFISRRRSTSNAIGGRALPIWA
jgi:hypothetical protein